MERSPTKMKKLAIGETITLEIIPQGIRHPNMPMVAGAVAH